MKLRIEIDGNLEETEIVIKTPTLTDEIADLQRLLQESKAPRLTFYKGTGEYYLDLSEILFFETEGSKIYAHTQKEAYEVRLKLYELESILPRYLVEFPSQRLQTSVRFTQWTSPFQERAPFPFIRRTRRFMSHGITNPS